MLRRLFSILLLALLWAAPVTAGEPEARAFAEKIGTDALAILNSAQDAPAKHASLKQLFTQVVDTDWVGRFVLGQYWRKLNPAQQQSYLTSYRSFLAATYTANFEDYAGDTSFKVTGVKPLQRAGQYLVAVDVLRPGQTIKIDYRLHETSGQFHIVDIVVEGVSLLATQRSEFSSVVQRQGIDTLISSLQKRAK